MRSGLTKEQKRQAEAAIYGLPTERVTMNPQLTHEEIERMRALVMAHDGQGRINEFDLAHPPTPPYKYAEFPRLMYKHATAKTRLAHSQAEVDAALEAGWSKEPFPIEQAEPELSDADKAEAESIDRQLVKKNRANRA